MSRFLRVCLATALVAAGCVGLLAEEERSVAPADDPAKPESPESPESGESREPVEPKAKGAASDRTEETETAAAGAEEAAPPEDGIYDVYVVPITEGITKPNRFVLRRALKDAIENEIEMVILDMDTPGGGVGYTLEMMEMLDKFDGITATYVNDDAISAGSFIAASTDEIYFAPRGKIGASAVIQGTGEDVPETAKQKIESYLRANIRVMTEDKPYRAEVIRAMLDAEYELEIEGEVIKPAGDLLTLTAKEAMREYGDPPRPLLGAGIHESVEDLLDARFGEGNYRIKSFELTYSEELAKWMTTFAPALLGLGMLALFIEFKTPGFGVFGIGGLILILIFFISNYIAGLAGNEPIVFFALGVLLVIVELLILPGTILFGLLGLGLMVGSLMWAMIDFWPGEGVAVSGDMLAEPLINLAVGGAIAIAGALLASRFLPGSALERTLVLSGAAGAGGDGGDGATVAASEAPSRWPAVGSTGEVVNALHPGGLVEIDGRRYEAHANVGSIDRGARVRVVRVGDFGVVVEEEEEEEEEKA